MMNSKLIKSLAVTSDDELKKLAEQLNIKIDGLYDFRDLKSSPPRSGSYLVLLRDQPGVGHWTTIYNGSYFDSMGAAPPSIFSVDTHNDKQYQGTYNEYCGLWCLLFLYSKQMNRPDLLNGSVILMSISMYHKCQPDNTDIMIYRINRSYQQPVVNDAPPSTSKKSDNSVISEIRSLSADFIRHKETENELQRLRNQLKELTNKYDALLVLEEQRKKAEPQTTELTVDSQPAVDTSGTQSEAMQTAEGAAVVVVEQAKPKEEGNSISKYFSELLTGPVEEFRMVFPDEPNDNGEYVIGQSAVYIDYMGWCNRTGENLMKQSNVMSCITGGHINGVRCAIVKGGRLIKAQSSDVVEASDE